MTVSQRLRSAGAGSHSVSSAGRGYFGVQPWRAPGRSGRVGKLCERHGGTRDDECAIGLRIGQVNVGSMRGRSAEVVETAGRRNLDICLLQETKWKGVQDPAQSRNQVRKLVGRDSVYKAFWSGNPEGTYGVGILLAETWADKVFEVQRPSDSIILLKLIIGSTVFSIINVYAPQQGRNSDDKDKFSIKSNFIYTGAGAPNLNHVLVGRYPTRACAPVDSSSKTHSIYPCPMHHFS